jgi:hypothetical protein
MATVRAVIKASPGIRTRRGNSRIVRVVASANMLAV